MLCPEIGDRSLDHMPRVAVSNRIPGREGSLELQWPVSKGSVLRNIYVWLLSFAISWYSRFVALTSGSEMVVLPDFAVEV